MPQWEHINAKFDTDYTDLKKSESTNILAIQAREHLNNKYQNHIKIFTDGSVLDIRQWSRIRYSRFKSAKIFLLREGFFHIYIRVICNINGIKLQSYAIYNFVICVDSKSALKNWNCKMRGDIFYKVKYLIHVQGYWD